MEKPDGPIHPTFGENLKWWREERGLSQRALGRATGIAWSTIRAYERFLSNPSYGYCCKLAKALGIPTEYLWDHRAPPIRPPEDPKRRG